MKVLINALTILMAAVLGLTVGLAWRAKSGSHSRSADTRARASAPSGVLATNPAPQVGKFRLIRAHDDSPLATKLEQDLSMSTGVTRWLYWLEAIEKAALTDFPRLALLARGNSTATRLLAARWVELGPRHLFDTIVNAGSVLGRGFPVNELASVLFSEWPKQDPEGVVAALRGTNSFGLRSNWRMDIASALIESDPECGLRFMSEGHLHNYGPRMNAVAKWAARDPLHAADVALANPAGYASQFVMETIGKEWAKTDPARALEFASAHPGPLSSMLAGATLKSWAARSLNDASDWLAAADSATRNRLSPAFVEAWAKQDAPAALAWCDANLSGNSQVQAIGGVLNGAAASDIVGAAGLVSDMKPSAARSEAASAVAQKWFPNSFDGKAVPPEAIEWLATLDAESVKQALEQIHFRWSETEPKSMAAFLASSSGAEVRDHVFSNLAKNLARQDPAEALEWASRLSEERGLAAGGTAFVEWRHSQPEAAMSWLRDLPAADARRDSFLRQAVQLLAYEPQAADQLGAFSASERATALEVITKMSLSVERRARLLEVLKGR